MRLTLTTLAATAALSAGAIAPASAAPTQISPPAPVSEGFIEVQSRGCYRGERPYDCRERLRYERQYRRSYDYRDGRYYSRNDNNNQAGAAIAGGILGFVLGAALAGNDDDRRYYDSNRGSSRYHSWCRARYRSYDRNTGTYLGNDGYRRYCRMR